MELSERLHTIVNMAGYVHTAADIGCDHGLTLIYLAKAGKIKKGIGCDVHSGPLERAKSNIKALHMADIIELRLGDGLEPLKDKEAQLVIMSGMGGRLMRRLLQKGKDKISNCEQLLLQPQTETGLVRQTLHESGYKILDETIINESGNFYIFINAIPGKEHYPQQDYILGRILPQKESPIFLAYVNSLIHKNQKILKSLAGQHSEPALMRKRQLLEENRIYQEKGRGVLK